jgi:hypothetical protein
MSLDARAACFMTNRSAYRTGYSSVLVISIQINLSLGELYKLLACNKISPRPGAVLAYTANLLFRTLPAIERELPPQEPHAIFDLPRPKRDWPDGNDPGVAAHENWDAYVSSLNFKPPSPSGDFPEYRDTSKDKP